MANRDYFAHPTSIIGENASIGSATKIWCWVQIMDGAVIGKNCLIGNNCYIEQRVVVGNNVKIKNNVALYEGVICEDDIFLGPNCVFTNVINPRAFISRKEQFLATIIKKGATIGANSTIVCGNTIGEYAFVGAGSVVTKDVPPYTIAFGNPVKNKGFICECGEKLHLNDNFATCATCQKEYVYENQKLRRVIK
jgi:UDP-2-acetamido-3-amino-2,3-dideoxy-glucuronate N-acetyltransferase